MFRFVFGYHRIRATLCLWECVSVCVCAYAKYAKYKKTISTLSNVLANAKETTPSLENVQEQ